MAGNTAQPGGESVYGACTFPGTFGESWERILDWVCKMLFLQGSVDRILDTRGPVLKGLCQRFKTVTVFNLTLQEGLPHPPTLSLPLPSRLFPLPLPRSPRRRRPATTTTTTLFSPAALDDDDEDAAVARGGWGGEVAVVVEKKENVGKGEGREGGWWRRARGGRSGGGGR